MFYFTVCMFIMTVSLILYSIMFFIPAAINGNRTAINLVILDVLLLIMVLTVSILSIT